MFDYKKETSRYKFTDEKGRNIFFYDNGIIIGVSGRALKKPPKTLGDCLMSISANGYLADAVKFYNQFYHQDFSLDNMFKDIELKETDKKKIFDTVERLFKVTIRTLEGEFYKELSFTRAIEMAKYGYAALERYEDITEAKLISLFQDRRAIKSLHYYDSVGNFARGVRIKNYVQEMWNGLPSIEYPDSVRDICDKVLGVVPSHSNVRALQQAVRNHLIENLIMFFNFLDRDISTISTVLIHYFEMCKFSNEEPNLNGNFLTKFNEVICKQDCSIFSTMQSIRPLKFENANFCVIVPKSYEELQQEGKAQSNCVGNAWYNKKVSSGECNVVFIRRKNEPKKSYITCEIDRDLGVITQFLFSHNRHLRKEDKLEKEFYEAYQDYLYSIW